MASGRRRKLSSRPPPLLTAAEKRLVEACGNAWHGDDRAPLRGYALANLPAHLIGLGRLPNAAVLLSGGVFLLVQLAASPSTVTAYSTASDTISLDVQLGGTHFTLAGCYRFQSETEAPLVVAMEQAGSHGLTAEGAFLQLAHDRFGPEAPTWRSLPTAYKVASCLHGIYRDGVGGVLALADGLVSWGQDGTIRHWSIVGEPQPGGSPKAHGSGGFSGMDGCSARA